MNIQTIQHWKLVRIFSFLLAILLTLYFGIFDYFKPPFELSSTLRGPSDRNIHIVALATMTFVLMVGQKKQFAYLAFILMLIFAAALESIQVFIPNRAASLDDLLASLAGVFIGASLARLTSHLVRKLGLKPGATASPNNMGRRSSDRKS